MLSGYLDQEIFGKILHEKGGSEHVQHCLKQHLSKKGVAPACEPSMESCKSAWWPRPPLQRYCFARSLRALSKEAVFISCTCLCRLRSCFAAVCLDDVKYSASKTAHIRSLNHTHTCKSRHELHGQVPEGLH